MAFLISTNMFKAKELKRVIPYLKQYPGQLGVEIFPMFHEEGYEELLRECLPVLKTVPVSFHGPYYKAEHSAAPGTMEYRKTMDMVSKTLEFAWETDCRYLVYHHNNCRVREDEAERMIQMSCANFRKTESLAKACGIPLVVENAGVRDMGNMLLGEDAFIRLCREECYQVLIDIGHAHANGWNLSRVMWELKDQIAAYHIHNNDGIHDSHRRLWDGTLNVHRFLEDCLCYTPGADWVLEYSPQVAGDVGGICSDIERLLSSPLRFLHRGQISHKV